MFRKILLTFFLVAQIASSSEVISQVSDTSLVKFYLRKSSDFGLVNNDSVFFYGEKALRLSRDIKYKEGEAASLLSVGAVVFDAGEQSLGLQYILKALHIYEDIGNEDGIIATHLNLQGIYREVGDFKKSFENAHFVRALVEKNGRLGTGVFEGLRMSELILAEIGGTHEEMNQLDSANFYIQRVIADKLMVNGAEWCFPYEVYGRILSKKGNYDSALFLFRKAKELASINQFYKDTLDIVNDIALMYERKGAPDSSIKYASKVIVNADTLAYMKIILLSSNIIYRAYARIGDRDSTLKYLQFIKLMDDRINNQQMQREFQTHSLNEEYRKLEIEDAKKDLYDRIKFYAVLAILMFTGIFLYILAKAYQNKDKAYHLLELQKTETENQKQEVEKAYKNLETTQSQLIQSEKMASLGELTAGIAHEIQNPLNFVNNFSDLNQELIDELKDEISKGDLKQVGLIVENLKENEAKINMHGKRADGIVKAMLQHSRASAGQKEMTDVNLLANEYLRLAYHGLRAKDKSFNTEIDSHLDPFIGKIKIIPQDIGRVFLNLYNNAFYAVSERMKKEGGEYRPLVSVTTRKTGENIEVVVSDNGSGIRDENRKKIFQPFFTTKPSGQGTGLGLSLSYDIITKGHGGELILESPPGGGTSFKIVLPIMQS